jgi:hypothetical protein
VTAQPVSKVRLARRVRVTLDLAECSHAILRALAECSGKSDDEVVGDALQLAFTTHPREGEAPTP